MSMEFQTKRITFPSAKNQPQTGQATFTFSGAVMTHGASINGWSLRFSSSDHHLYQEEVDVRTVRDTTTGFNQVIAKATIALRDSSGTFDDAFEGYVDVLVAAQIAELEIAPGIRDGDKVALRAINGKYVSAEEGAGRKLQATKATIGDEERFTVEILDNLEDSYLGDRSRFALRANNGKFVCAEGGGGRELIANRDQIGPWETFVLKRLETVPSPGVFGITDGGAIAIFENTGRLVCAEGGGGRELIANRWKVGPWETFVIVKC